MTEEAIAVPLEALPAHGLRKRSVCARAIHRFPDPDEAAQALPPCVLAGQNTTPDDSPDAYKRVRVALAVETRRFALCSYPACFGRLEAAPDAPAPDLAGDADRPTLTISDVE